MGPVDLYDATDNPLGNAIPNANFMITTGGINTNCNVGSNIPANMTAQQSMVSGTGLVVSEVTVTTVPASAPGYDPRLGNLLRVTAALALGKTGLTKVNIRSDFILTAGMNEVGAILEGVFRVSLANLQGFAGADMVITYRSDSGGTVSIIRRGLSPNITNGFNWSQENHNLLIVTPRLTIPSGAQNTPRVFASIDLYWDARAASAAGQAEISDFQMRRVG